jgi:enoyl-CoA hydratase/carnithine racemase
MSLIEVEREGSLARVRLNRPEKYNAQTPAMWHELRLAGEVLMADADVRVVVLSGNGKCFSAGLDVKASQRGEVTGGAMSGREADRDRREIQDGDIVVAQAAFRWLTEAPFVTVAAVHGYALGAGAELVLSCDLRVLADDVQLSLPEAELGMMPDMGGCERLAAIVGYSRAIELALTCRRIDATEALALGVATSVVPAAELDARVSELAGLVASRPALTTRFVKRAIAASARGDRDGSFALAREGALRLIEARAHEKEPASSGTTHA